MEDKSMIVSFKDLEGRMQRVTAKVTTRHTLSLHGQPILVLSDGETVDVKSWADLCYHVVSATTEERHGLNKIGLH
jgi:hypothetical protein